MTKISKKNNVPMNNFISRNIGLYVNSDKTEFTCFNQDGALSSLNGKPLKLVDKFAYLSSNISSTESDIIMHIGKIWTTINKLSIILKSDKIKPKFFQAVAASVLPFCCTT